ncbi:MAG: HAD family phosphatase [Actinobacteria bacterium]|nr:HAD family phosphatase [Actinomycetota bacterium]
MENFFSAVLFDMDGLFANSEPLWLEGETELMAKFGHTWTHADQVYCLGGPLTRVGEYMFSLASAESPEFFTKTLVEIVVAKLSAGTQLMPGAQRLASALKAAGVPIAMVSASPRNIVNAVLSGVEHDFATTISSDDVKNTKPDPEGYLKAADFFGLDITNCLIFEDSLTGVAAATSSGAFLIAVPHFVTVDESPRVRVIKSLEELDIEVLEKYYADFMAW